MKYNLSTLWVIYYDLGGYSHASLAGDEVYSTLEEAMLQCAEDNITVDSRQDPHPNQVCTLEEWISMTKEVSYERGYTSGVDPLGDNW